mmetsp:Transcript_56262/g.147947  ORF Transcript_56262/g.147947 Transcript_56262/m.147947 type:complete len:311 (+) Transcript_56262:928-1860(+)
MHLVLVRQLHGCSFGNPSRRVPLLPVLLAIHVRHHRQGNAHGPLAAHGAIEAIVPPDDALLLPARLDLQHARVDPRPALVVRDHRVGQLADLVVEQVRKVRVLRRVPNLLLSQLIARPIGPRYSGVLAHPVAEVIGERLEALLLQALLLGDLGQVLDAHGLEVEGALHLLLVRPIPANTHFLEALAHQSPHDGEGQPVLRSVRPDQQRRRLVGELHQGDRVVGVLRSVGLPLQVPAHGQLVADARLQPRAAFEVLGLAVDLGKVHDDDLPYKLVVRPSLLGRWPLPILTGVGEEAVHGDMQRSACRGRAS